MKFIDDWKQKFPKLWSVRFALVAALASAVETGMNLYATGTAPLLVVAAGLTSIGAAIARIVAQPALAQDGNA